MKANKSIVGNFLTNILMFPLTITVGVLTARTLGPDGKGVFAFLVLLVKSMLPILFLGYGAGVQYYVASKQHTVQYSIFTNFIVAVFGGSLISGVIFILWKFGLLGSIGDSIEENLIYPILFALPFNAFFIMSSLTLKGNFQFKLFNIIQLVKGIGLALLLVIFVIVLGFGLQGAVWALVIEAVITAIVLVFIFMRNYKPIFKFNITLVKQNWRYGIKSWIGTLAQESNDKLDQILIGFFATPQLLGLYSVAFSIVKMLNFLPNAIAPVFFNLTAESKDRASEVQLTGQIHRALMLIVGPGAILIALTSPYIIQVLYGVEFMGAVRPLQILIPGMLAYSITRRILTKYLASKGMPEKTSLIQIIGAIVGAVLYFLLIPKYDIVGAAVGSSLAYISSSAFAVFVFTKVASPYRANLFALSLGDLKWMRNKLIKFYPLKKK